MRKILLILFCLLTFSIGAQAQGAPEVISKALEALSTELGVQVNMGDLKNWTWEQKSFGDASLDCPKEGESYTQQVVEGYIFNLTYANIIYEYHVSADGNIAVLCQQTDLAEATEEPGVFSDGYNNPLCPAPEEGQATYMRTFLKPNIGGQVLADESADIRVEANQAAESLAQMPAGALFYTQDGFICADGVIWRTINFDGIIGWVAESENGNYFVSNTAPNPLQDHQVISSENASFLVFQSLFEGNFSSVRDWDPTGKFAVLGAKGLDAVLIYDSNALHQTPQRLNGQTTYTDMRFNADGSQLILGAKDGTVHIWNTSATSGIQETLVLNLFQNEVTQADFAPDGLSFAVAGKDALTTREVNKGNVIFIVDVETLETRFVLDGHTDTITDLHYTADGSKLISASANPTDMSIKVWDAANGTLIQSLEHDEAPTAVIPAPNNLDIIVGFINGQLAVESPTGERVVSLQAHDSAIQSVFINADSSLLLTGSENGTVSLWAYPLTEDAEPIISIQHDEAIADVSLSPDGSVLSVTTRSGKTLYYTTNN